MMRMVPRTAGLRGAGRGEDPGTAGIPEGDEECQQFDGIDWSAAAPSWASIITGLVLPSLAIIALVIFIDYALCRLFGSLINHSWAMAPWLLSIMMLPLALLCAFACGKIFLHLKRLVHSR
jgi:hypothetical protein